jgi:hypothetical protein
MWDTAPDDRALIATGSRTVRRVGRSPVGPGGQTAQRRTRHIARSATAACVVVTIHADEIQPGDVVAYGGYERRIARVDRRDGWAWPIASDDHGWAVALDDHLVDVRRVAMRCKSDAEATRDRDVITREQAPVR